MHRQPRQVEEHQKVEDKKPWKPLAYLETFNKLKSIHEPVQNVLDKHSRILEELKIPMTLSMSNISHYHREIEKQLKDDELGDIYSNISLLSSTFPDYDREQFNLITLHQREIMNLVLLIGELVEATNHITERIITNPVPTDRPPKTEQERLDYENLQKRDLMSMTEAKAKSSFNILRNTVLNRINTEEERALTNNICSEFFGKKIDEVEWKPGKKK